MRHARVVLFAVLLLLCGTGVYAHNREGKVEVDIVPDYGSRFRKIPFRDFFSGQTHIIKQYLEARKGENYSIVVRNPFSERIGVVIAVDGRNIITGKKSYLKHNEMMYILEPYGNASIEGWRTDNNTVHRFYFTEQQDSYSVRTFGDTSAMGVITIAVFREKERPVVYYDRILRENAPAPSAGAPAGSSEGKSRSESAGTGFGDGKYSPVVKVEFEPEAAPSEKILLKYEWREVLCRKGLVNCRRQEDGNRLWDESGYAPFPPRTY